jgi:hypothetical protein
MEKNDPAMLVAWGRERLSMSLKIILNSLVLATLLGQAE